MRTMREAVTPEEKQIAAAQAGDIEAFETLVREHHPNVRATTCHLMGNEADADDVAQEVWIRVYRALPRFRFQSKFSTWLYRIAVNQSLTALRQRNRRPGGRKKDLELDAQETEFPLKSCTPDARRTLEGKEAARAFHVALQELPVRQRLAVTLVLLQGLTHREAGAVLEVAEKTVSWHLFKARKRLMEMMKDVL